MGLTAGVVALGGSLLGCVYALRAVRGGPLGPAIAAIRAAFAALLAGVLLMEAALVTHDFSVAYVAEVGSRETPLLYTVASLWAALEGSILLWALLLGGVTVLLTWRIGERDRPLLPASLAVLAGLLAFFTFIVVGPGNPWGRVDPVPTDGPGPNPLLQNHPLMAIHPPLLYLGFVGLAVPFALTVAALWTGGLDRSWLAAVRRWTLGPWISLTLALIAGAWWSYAVLGWGGYWAWDPVENVALLPWLTATAFLHSAMAQERRGSLGGWNVVLVVASFALTLLATLVTRSGILTSVHAFTQSAIGPLFLALFAIVLVGSLTLIVLRLPPVGAEVRLGTQPAALLLNNLLLVALAGTVLIGTLFPLLAEALGAGQLSVGAPYFERVVGPLALALVVLLGVGPSLPWGAWGAGSRRRLLLPATIGGATALALAASGAPPEAVAGTAAAGFALAGTVSSMLHQLRGLGAGTDRVSRRRRLWARRRSIGGLVAHLGVALVALVVVAEGVGNRAATVTLQPGTSTEFGPYTLTFVASQQQSSAGRSRLVADVRVAGAGAATLTPSLTLFPNASEAIASPAVDSSVTGDLYLTLVNVDSGTGDATFRIGLHPWMSWLWAGGGVAAAGGLLAWLPPDRRRRPQAAALAMPGETRRSALAGGGD